MRPFSRRGSLLLSVAIAASFISNFSSFGQVLTPPYFNLAEGRRINASSTCGEGVPEPELYCKLVGADTEKELNVENLNYQGQYCDYCDPKSKFKMHPAEHAVDGRKTWWQSPPLSRGMSYNEVNLTIELGQEFHVAYVIIKMGNSPRPRVWVLERSGDNGQTYSPWQYFADSEAECRHFFGSDVDFQIKADDTVICSYQFSKIVPLEGGEIVVPLVQNRPSANDFFNSTVLQDWTRATNVRFRLLGVKNLLGHLMSIARQDVTTTRRYYYSIEDISIGGRCRCNGHADTCTADDENDPFKRVCDCKDHTCGRNCEYCCPGFEQKKWSQSKNNKKFTCEACNCFGHSSQCVYNETVDNLKLSLDLQGNYEGGGVCQNCQHNTEGTNCNKCVNGYYRPYGKNLSDIDVCQPCRCDYPYSTGNCEDGSGRCECKEAFTKPNCDSCSFGYYGYPLCRPCDCYINGTSTLQCQADNGRCSCKFNYGGVDCRTCAEKFYSFPECKPCDCNSVGSASNVCDLNSGDCKCLSNYGGRTCNECKNGYHSFPTCSFCNCDVKGTLPEVCDKANGKCLCKPGYGGPRCDACVVNYTGFPDCKSCNCSDIGSVTPVCDATGSCTCYQAYSGKLCDKCTPGNYNYPSCIPCGCNPDGSNGVTCNSDGACVCKPNFRGIKCEQCNIGYYNFPTCEKCSFDPAGVISSFTSCPADLRQIECKKNVFGRKCSECKDLYWNLQPTNPFGCEDCDCNLSGTVARLGSCNMKTGQCLCKASVTSRRCSQCSDGYYSLSDTNLFGCTDCDCDVGGSVSSICDKRTGQCTCQPRVEGRNCKQALTTSYFPTLHQFQYEIEDGYDPEKNPVSYGFDEKVFPGYSWKGYAVFSQLQSETIHDVMIDKPSIYRIILRYISLNNQAVSGEISLSPESSNDSEQKFEVLFKPSKTPSFVTVAGINGNNPSPFVLNPGPWVLKIKTSKNLFLDYFVLIPAEYYEATALVVNVTVPCTVDKMEVCRQYVYPNISVFDQKKGSSGYINNGDSSSPVQLYFEESEMKFGKPKMAVLSDAQRELIYDLTLTHSGPYVIVITYATTKNLTKSTIEIEASTQSVAYNGTAAINSCRYSSLCRAVAVNRENQIAVFDFDNFLVKIILKGAGDGIGIESVVAIPREKWALDYIQPQPSCIKKDNNCFPSIYSSPPESKRIDFKTGNENRINATKLPSTIFDNSTELVFLDYQDSMVDVSGKVAKPGPYTFVVHYYQPDFPEFDMNVIVHNGHFYEAQLPVKHCPGVSGCRSVIQQTGVANNVFKLNESFVLTLKEPNHKSIWLHYVLVIPSSQYNPNILNELPFDLTASFISQCGQNNFYIDTKEEGFCKEALFSLSTKYNHGTIQCQCDFEGSMSFECEKFGGQCPCHKNIVGRRCDTCKTGYFGFPNCQSCNCSTTAVCDTVSGECQCPRNVHGEKCNKCIPYTYGFDPIHGCRQCNCNIRGVKSNQLQCNDFDGSCDCKEHVEGRTCDRCSAGFYQFPVCEACDCDLRGTTEDICNQTSAACFCKNNVHGSACDVCKDGTFNLQADNPEGCTKCFCFGKTSRCFSSDLFTKNVSTYQNWLAATISQSDSVNVELSSVSVQSAQNSISLNVAAIPEGIAYLSAPKEFLGNKLTSYGNHLAYTVLYDGNGDPDSGANVILYGAQNYLLYYTDELPETSVPFEFSVKIVEGNFRSISGLSATREEMMQVLQNLTALYIKASYAKKGSVTTVSKISIEIATQDYHGTSIVASAVEKCQCPPSYVGLSCEECADGFYRVPTGPFGGYCVPCQCNGHSNSCDKTTGICHSCKHNTKGEHCEKCEMGYYGNATVGTPNDCLICACPLPTQSNNFATGCDINDLGDKIICDCIPGYAGARCERCGAGFYGRPEVTGETCAPCQCNGNIDPSDPGACDHVTGRCLKCLNNTFGDSCDKCAPGYFGDAVIAKDCQPCVCDKCGTKECDHRTGQCHCHDNIVGEKCDRCADQHYGFTTCQGCTPCKCDIASESLQCDDTTGYCRCKAGVFRKTCDQCSPGFWNYSADGCISCGCNTGYSIGMGCNAKTGLCECLSGVIGEKCDACPYRNVLIPNDGCLACDNCTHGLLDVTDEIRRNFEPILHEFKTETIGYFTAQRLKFINNSFEQLAPKIKDIVSFQFDVSPYEKNISIVEGEAENIHRNTLSIYNDATSSQEKGNSAFDEATKLDSLVDQVTLMAKATVQKIFNLGYSLETSAGPQIDYALAEAQQNLVHINNLDLDEERKTEVTDMLAKANQTLQNALNFVSPVNGTVSNLNTVKSKYEKFVSKLEELDNHTAKAQKTAVETTSINENHKKANLPERVKSLVDITADANKTLQEVSSLLKNTSDSVDTVQNNFAQLAVSNQNIKDAETRANTNVEMLKNNLQTASDEVKKAYQHATELENQAKILQDQKSVSSDHAVEAATSYKNIISALDDARNLTDKAKQDADTSAATSEGLKDRIHSSQQKSTDVLDEARKTHDNVKQNLQPELDAILELEKNVAAMINQTENSINTVTKWLKEPANPNDLENKLKNLNADNVSNKAKEALSGIENIAQDLPMKLEQAKKLYGNRTNEQKASVEANDFVDKTELRVPTIQEYINKLKDKPETVNTTINKINDTIEMLQEKISMAKDLAAKIAVGATLHSNTVLELPIPSSLLDQGSSTDISMYFKTGEPNGLLLYIGNEVTPRQKRDAPKLRRPKTDDYIAVEIENGYVALTADIGEKQVSHLVIADTYVANNMWYNVRVERVGKTMNLTLIEEISSPQKRARKHSVSGETTGTHFVLNLDKDQSKFYIGGLPPTFSAPPTVKNTFNGQVEELTVDDVPIGLWNFVKIHAPSGIAPSKIVNGSIERDVLKKTESSTGCRFVGDGYIKLSARGYLSVTQMDIVLQFKTISSDGLLFITHKNDIFVSIELRAGYIYYQYNVGKGIISLHTPITYNNDLWHTVEAKRYQHNGLLRVDGKDIQRQTNPDPQSMEPVFELPDHIYIGGYSGDHKISEVTKMSFEGCIDGFQINSQAVDLNKNLNAHGIIPGCPERFSKFVSFNEGDRGYIRWPRENSRLNFSNTFIMELTLRIKTKSKDGLIAYGTGGDTRFSLLLVDGSIVFRGFKSEVNTGPNMKYNDDRWHAIMAFHDSNSLHLLIDDFDMFKSTETSSSRQNYYTLPGKLFFGSVPADIDKTAAFEIPFNGCIGDATFNGVVINFDEIAEGKDAAIGRCSGPGQQIQPSHPVDKPSKPDSSTPETQISTVTEPSIPEGPITVAPGSLPLNPAIDTDLSADSGFRFGTRKQSAQTYAFNNLQYQGSMDFSVKIKTISPDGIIFYVTQPQNKDFLALYLKDSKLHFRFSCSSESATLTLAGNIIEGEWHTIQMTVSQTQTKVWIEGQEESGASGVGCKTLNIASPHYIGGADAIALETAAKHLEGFNKTLVGCLRNFKHNGRILSPSTSVGVVPCSNKVEKGTYFPRQGGFLKAYERFKVGRNVDIRMEIKPRNTSGLLLAVHAKKDFLVLQMNEGSINFTVENGNGPVSTTFIPPNPEHFCDGQWHTIIASKTKNIIGLTIDEKQVDPVGIDFGASSVTDTAHPLYIGGYPASISKSPGIMISNTQYVGCIRNLMINSEPQDFYSFTAQGDVMFNICPTI